MDTAAAIDSILAAGHRLGTRGLISAGEGNLSVRLDSEWLLVTPTGLRKDELGSDDLVRVRSAAPDPGARSTSGRRPTSDLAIHIAIHVRRPDIGAVVHAHLPAAMSLTLGGEVPDPAVLPETAMLLPRLPFVATGVPGSDELADRIASAMATPPEPLPGAVLLERHGAYAVGTSPAEAIDRLELIEVLCRTWRDALLIRAARQTVGMVVLPNPGTPSEGT